MSTKPEQKNSAPLSGADACYDCVVDIVITAPNDPTVGLFSETWIIENVTIVPQLRQQLREAAKEFFESYVAGEYCEVRFSDEIEAESKQFEPEIKKQS